MIFNRKKKKLRYRPTRAVTNSRRLRKRTKPGRIRKVAKKPRLQSKTKKRLIIYLTIALSITLIYVLFFSNTFLLKEIKSQTEITGNQALATKIDSELQNYIGENLVLLNARDLESEISSILPEIQEIDVKKSYPHSLTFSFAEYPLSANIINESNQIKKTYIVSSIGYAIKEDLENPELPYIRIKSDEPINLNTNIIEPAKLAYILESTQYFEERFGMKIIEVEYKKIAREIHLLTERDFHIWLDIQQPYESQLKKLKKAAIRLDIYSESLDYVDLRIAGNNGDKLIYKKR